MEIRSLADVELKDALGPINRAAGGRTEPGMLPLVHTAAQLRERAALGVLDLKLSQALVLPGGIAGACLVERSVSGRTWMRWAPISWPCSAAGAGRSVRPWWPPQLLPGCAG